jgi:hypothetical protein
MIEMQMGEEHIGNILFPESLFFQRIVEIFISMQIIITEKFSILLVANSIVHQDQLCAILHQQTAHSPGTKIVGIGRIGFIPDELGNDTKHGASVELEIAGVDGVDFHVIKLGTDCLSLMVYGGWQMDFRCIMCPSTIYHLPLTTFQ